MGTSLYLESGAIDISGYRWVLSLQDDYQKGNEYVTLDGDKGTYRVYWTIKSQDGIPTLKIVMGDKVILEEDMNAYLDRITVAYPPGRSEPYAAQLDDMSLKYETGEVSVMIVFRNVDIYVNTRDDIINYGFNLDAVYMNEK